MINNESFIIDDLDMNGLGIAHGNSKTYFIENALPGEKVEVKQTKEKGNLVFGKTARVIEESKDRVEPKCPYFLKCGGCDIQHLHYSKSLNFKKEQILHTFKKICGINLEQNLEVEKSQEEYYYRNKLSMHIKDNNGVSKLCYVKKQSHEPVFVDNCFLADKKFKIVIDKVNAFLKEQSLPAFNEKTKKGLLKHLVARIIDNNLLVTLVSVKNFNFNVESLYLALKESFDRVGINLNINSKSKEILSDNFKHLIGDKEISFEIMGVQQKITNASFLQVNFNIQNKLYSYVLDNVSKVVVNAYSGAGMLTCLLSKKCEDIMQNNDKEVNIEKEPAYKVIGIELNKEASKLADLLMKENDAKNVINICGDACEELKKLNYSNYTLVLDPPRSGISEDMIKTILNQKPEKIVYIACSLLSLCKNLREILNVYSIEKIKAFDMFPQTKNIETVVVLKRK